MEFNERLFQAIKKDDVKEFNSCMETSNCGPLRLGRFPVLSVMYLYNSRRILHAYEKAFVKLNSWKDIGEPLELSGKFRSVAGKCLRIYLNEIVTPIEMLLLLDRSAKVRKVYQQCHVSPPVRQRLVDIYYIRWGLTAQFVRNKIVLERRPMTRAEIKQWLLRSVCALLCVAIIVSTPFVANAFVPFITDAEGVLNVVSVSQIRFKSNKTYALKNDIKVPADFFVEEMNCDLNGNGHTVTVEGDGFIGKLNGSLKNITFATNGSPVVQSVELGLETTIENNQKVTRYKIMADGVTVNANVDVTTDSAIGFFANDNYGYVTDVTVNVSGALTGVAPQAEDDESSPTVNCGGIVANNQMSTDAQGHYYARLLNSTVNFDSFTLTGESKANFAFGGIVGLNDAYVSDCTTTGSVASDTFDIAGICAENHYGVLYSENKANLTQVTAADDWNPIVAGVVLVNLYAVERCVNSGNVTAVSTAPAQQDASEGLLHAEASGIAYMSYGGVRYCVNNGDVTANSNQQAIVGGIVSTNYWEVVYCKSFGNVTAHGKVCYVGGIAGYSSGDIHNYFGYIRDSIAACDIEVTVINGSGSVAAVGGIVGYLEERPSEHNRGEMVFCYFTGSIQVPTGAYAGGIVGLLGENTYNMFAAVIREDGNGNEQTYFMYVYYAVECGASSAFGRAYTANGSYRTVGDIGVQAMTKQEIESSNAYQETLDFFEER